MAQKQFNRFGLRRDLNLSDLPSATAALNNILANPTMLGSEASFTTEDLEPIQGIYITNITASTFSSLDGVTVAFTIIENGIVDNSSNPKVYRPLIKIKNRLDAAYFSTGEPFFFGGDGPNATYYDNANIVRDAPAYSSATDTAGDYKVGDIVSYSSSLWRRVQVTQTSIPSNTSEEWFYVAPYTDLFFDDEIDSDGNVTTLTDNFWERGQFVYSDKLQSSFLSLFGGTNWQGFYKPTVSGTTTFLVNTTGSTIFKFQEPASQSFQAVRYGAPSSTVFNYFNAATPINEGSTNYKQSQVTELLTIYNDPTRQLVEVELEDAMNLKHGDLVYLDVEEGQVPAQRYRVLTFYNYADEQEIPVFYIEVTEEFNKLNLDSSTLPNAAGGYITTLNTGNYSKSSSITIQGLKAVVRYTPYDRKNLKTYLNSYRHRTDIDLSAGNAITSATTFTVSDSVYQNIMINDFIYDYRIADDDVDPANTTNEEFEDEQGVRRYIVTACSSSGGVNTITVEIDDSYTEFDDAYNNDQQYYFRYDNTTSEYSIQAQNELDNIKIENTYTTGSLNHTLYSGNTFNKLLHVARMGELTTRQRYITIEQYLDRYVDYIFDWTFFMKDEDVDPNSTNKAWILRQRTETSGGYGLVSYKYLYEKDYEFYQIGDFKTFLDNSVLSGGTSREDGVDQRAFGKRQLITAGDQYNTLYSLLPIKSIYTPQENWNSVALSRTGSISSDSRLLSLNNATDVQIGNYVVRDTSNGFLGGEGIDYGTRIIDVLPESNSVVLNKEAITPFSNQNLWILNHRGFVTTGTLTWDGTRHYLQMDSRRVGDIKSGQILVFKDSPSTQTYVRITRVDLEPNDDTIVYVNIDSQNPYPTSNGGSVAVYNDKGIDITKPLQTFCVGTACAQNNYQGDGINKTKYIAFRIYNGDANSGLDIRWTESSLTPGYGNVTVTPGTNSNPTRAVFTPTGNTINSSFSNWGTGPSVAWWTDADTGFSYPGQATRVGDVSNPSGRKRYGGAQIYANISGSNLEAAINEKLGPGNTFPYNSLIPLGIFEGIIRVDGDIWSNTAISGSERYYGILRLTTDLSSVPQPDNGYNPLWQDGTLSSDGQTQLPIKIDFSEFPSSAFNITKWAIPPAQDNMLPYGGTVSSASNIQNVYTNYTNSIIANADRQWRATTDITLTQSQAQTWFLNSTSLAQDDGNGNITYVMKADTWFKTYSTTGKLLYFDTFESVIDTETFFTYRPSSVTNSDSTFNDDPELINLFNNDGPTKITSNTYTDQFQFMHYRNKIYQIIPTPIGVEKLFPGIRMIDPNPQTTGVLNHLENTTNALSVYTFANTTENKELCCPPLDTSPPFDSSEIGLSTTILNPDFHVDGLVNVRSLSANHPEDKIHAIPSNINNTQLPVNEKLEIVFGGVKYDMLIGNSKPF